jgi:superfamily I DNA/RNA helicase
MDDRAFWRVLNKPTRGIGQKVVNIIKAHQGTLNDNGNKDIGPVGSEYAAKDLLQSKGMALSNGQKDSLEKFFRLLHSLRVAAIQMALPDLLHLIWNETGLEAFYIQKALKGKDTKVSSVDQMAALVSLAESHVEKLTEREQQRQLACQGQRRVKSLFEQAKECLVDHIHELPEDMLPQLCLPQVLIDDLYMPGGVGLPVVSSFLADLALQTKDEGQPGDEDDRVTISTIHRAKGLEWNEVYVPYFNEGYMPTQFRENGGNKISIRHHNDCALRANSARQCNMGCARRNADREYERRGLTPEQLHSDEERRLAHVAATRAKDRLVFITAGVSNGFGLKTAKSSFGVCLQELPASVCTSSRE